MTPQEKPHTRRFRPTGGSARPEPALVARQATAAALAYRVFGSAEGARHFLNGVDESLGGRPIDVAGRSVEGLRQVSDALRRDAPASPAADGG